MIRAGRDIGRGPRFADSALEVVRRNPVPVLLIAAGIGWLAVSVGQDRRHLRRRSAGPLAAEDIPVLNTGQTRVYDPDHSTRHPTHDLMETPRDLSARA